MKNISKKKKIMLIVLGVILVIILALIIFLAQNKTFFKNKYINIDSQEIFIPRFSYLKNEKNNQVTLISLKSKKTLEKEISNYLDDLSYFVDTETAGYKKENLIIYTYKVLDKKWYREIVIVYN